MTLKNIEINSFKSFGKKSVVSFTAPIVAIVGPNGSGKSNIVEAIRFVLGEQSMKSLRGKGGVDLIFKGSKMTSQASHAGVIITFDNSKKIFSFTGAMAQGGHEVSLDFDEITISREVFQDGTSKYSINNTEVRLKDILDLLASVNIGSSGHHIISQGEADRILNASLKDRRAMIEDALGLKIYQYRIRESERKLEKTTANMKEVSALRREIAPHLAFLKKQVEKVEKMREMRENLRDLYKEYISKESSYINFETKRLKNARHLLEEKIASFDKRIEKIKGEKSENNNESEYAKEIKNDEEEIHKLRSTKDDLARRLGRLEGMIEGLEKSYKNKEVKKSHISEDDWQKFINEIDESISRALEMGDLPSVVEILKGIKNRLNSFGKGENKEENNNQKIEENKEYQEMQKSKKEIESEIEKIKEEEKRLLGNVTHLRQKESEAELSLRDSERVLYELLNEKNTATSEMHSLSFEEEKLGMIKNAFDTEKSEARVLIGQDASNYAEIEVKAEDINRQSQDELHRKIERIKIKLEDAGAGSGTEISKEYEDTRERDLFLARELEDLNKGVDSLQILIDDLKETLDKEFKTGVEKINKQFHEFFVLMFGGGSASLSITVENKKLIKDDESVEDEELEDLEEKIPFEKGIEISVNLPKKKVKDLHMLSGGERSLVSIALLFAISQVNPPPFLVLDETDAALDEANSRKYASMLENLSRYSQLIVVTHNRETMSRANVLYGVTMGADGTSKLLSIKLENAESYAK